MCHDTFCLKTVLLFFNSMCFVGGLIKAVASIANLKYADTMNNLMLFFALRIMVSVSVLATASFGFYSILPENKDHLRRYTVLQLIFAICELFLMTVRFYNRNYLINGYSTGIFEKETLHYIEKEYSCCGMHGPKDYSEKQLDIPETCYSKPVRSKTKVLHDDGCVEKVEAFQIDKHLKGTIVFIIFLVLQAIATILAARYANQLRRANTQAENIVA